MGFPNHWAPNHQLEGADLTHTEIPPEADAGHPDKGRRFPVFVGIPRADLRSSMPATSCRK